MELTDLGDFFKWCLVLNAGILLVWSLVYLVAKDTIYQIHSRWFEMPKEKFASIHYRLLGQYKIAIFVFNLVPWIALLIMLP
ncbi:MAG: hypothetical protein P8M53_13905 [Pirellulales bacterium]|nr:hypothetical protein [Pirellulales bacterium]